MPIKRIQRASWKQRAQIAWIILFSAGVVWAVISIRNESHSRDRLAIQNNQNILVLKQLVKDGIEAHDDICAFRVISRNQIKRDRTEVAQTFQFVKQHPEGFLGFSAKQLRKTASDQLQDVNDRVKVLNALKGKCP